MILTVTLNAAVDKTYRVDHFSLDRVHRPSEWRIVAGGKGINVARVVRTLGGEAFTTGFLGGYNGRYIAASLKDEGIAGRFVRTADESRVCIAIVDGANATQTEVNEVGPNVTAREMRALYRMVGRLLDEQPWDFLVLSGSLPPGVPDTVYADLVIASRRRGVRCVLDASGQALRAGLDARPWMAKPNVHELADVLGRPTLDAAESAQAARDMVCHGIAVGCVTMGSEGAVAATANGVWAAVPPRIRFVSAVGSGDSFLGAFLRAWQMGAAPSEALRRGVGAGAANAAVYGAGFCSADSIGMHAEGTQVRPL